MKFDAIYIAGIENRITNKFEVDFKTITTWIHLNTWRVFTNGLFNRSSCFEAQKFPRRYEIIFLIQRTK